MTAEVLSNNHAFNDPDYNAVQPGQPVTFTCAFDVIPRQSDGASDLMIYDVDSRPATLDIGIAVSVGPAAPEPDGVLALLYGPNSSSNIDGIALDVTFPSGISITALERRDAEELFVSDLLMQNGSIALTGLVPNFNGDITDDYFWIHDAQPNAPGRIELTNVTLTVTVPPSPGTSYCNALPNSTDAERRLTIAGSPVAGANDLHLLMYNLPSSAFGMVITSQTQGNFPNTAGAGDFCLGGTIGRFNDPAQLQVTDAKGFASLQVDLTSIPQGAATVPALAGQTWNFQFWYRDHDLIGSNQSNLTNAVSVPFL